MPEETTATAIDYLIVDSREERRATIAKILAESGGRILAVASGRAGRDILSDRQREVGFVIAAISMPRMTGIELLRLIRRTPRLFDLPVLLVQDHEMQEEALFAREEGADHVINGPVDGNTLDQAIATIRQQRRNRTPADLALLAARQLYLKRDYDQAISQTLEIPEVHTNAEALHLLSECHYRAKNFEKALHYLKQLISSPTSKTLHLLSKVCQAESRCGDAITHLTKANLRYPSCRDLKIDQGKLYLSLGMQDQADAQFSAVLQEDPSDLNLVKMGRACLAHDMVAQATDFLDRVEDPLPETTHIFAELAQALANNGDLTGAVRQYEKCLRVDPENPTFQLNVSKLYLKTDRYGEALTIINNLHQRFPDNDKIRQILTYLQSHKN